MNQEAIDLLKISSVILTVAGSIGGYAFLVNRAAERLGVELNFDGKPVKKGQEITFSVVFKPTKETVVNGVSAKLSCVESNVERRSESSFETRGDYDVLYERTAELAQKTTFRPGQDVTLEGSFEVPQNAKCTHKTGNFSRTWTLRVDVDIPLSPDINARRDIKVLPY